MAGQIIAWRKDDGSQRSGVLYARHAAGTVAADASRFQAGVVAAVVVRYAVWHCVRVAIPAGVSTKPDQRRVCPRFRGSQNARGAE